MGARGKAAVAFTTNQGDAHMDQIRTAGELSQDQTQQDSGLESRTAAQEIRTLSDLELVLAGGGDGIVTWP